MADNINVSEEIYGEQVDEIAVEMGASEEGSAKINNLEDATRYAYGLSETKKSIQELEDIASKEIGKWQSKIAEVNKWLEEVVTPLKDKEKYLSHLLLTYHTEQYMSADEKAQKKLTSIKLPYNVTLASRAQQPKFDVVNEEVYKEYAEANSFMKEPKPAEVDWAAMKKVTVVNTDGRLLNKETGEFLDFIKVVPQERKFEVK